MPSSVCASPSLRLFLTIYTVIQKLDIRLFDIFSYMFRLTAPTLRTAAGVHFSGN